MAALAIVGFHATAHFRAVATAPQGAFGAALFAAFDHLWLGVQIFFVLSGYCIAATVDSVRRKPRAGREFAVRRLRRIYPPYLVWLAVLASVIVGLSVLGVSMESTRKSLNPGSLSWINWVGNFTLTDTWLPRLANGSPSNITRVGWTLCYEVQFYLVCWLLLVLRPKSFFPAAAILTAVLAALFAVCLGTRIGRVFAGTFLDGRWLQFALGLGLFWSLNYASGRARKLFAAILAGLALTCIVARAWTVDALPADQQKKVFELAFSAVFAIVLFLGWRLDASVVAARWVSPLMRCGVISYSLYLVHWPFCKVLGDLCWRLGMRDVWTTTLATLPVCAAVSLLAAVTYFHLVERHFLGRPNPSKADLRTPIACNEGQVSCNEA